MKHLEVVCAVIVNKDGKLLACQRGASTSLPRKWEFPGGKIEQGESAEQALKREISEELEVQISILQSLVTVNHRYPEFDISLTPFLCKMISSEAPKLVEHSQIRWVDLSEASQLDWAEADLPILQQCKYHFNDYEE